MTRLLAALALFLLVCAPLAARAATLTASVDRDRIEMGETITLVLSLAGGDSTRPPDLSGLSPDFDVVQRARTGRPVTTNGKTATVNDWILVLAPRRTGTLTIPAMQVSGASSEPVRVTVTQPAPGPTSDAKPLFVDVAVAPGAVYAQGEVKVQVRIYDSLGMLRGSYDQLKADGASFRKEGEQDSYLKTIGKTRYRVIDQSYVMTPQRSGTIEIEPVTLTATIPGPSNAAASEMARLLGRSNVPMPWLESARGQEVTLHSAPVKVEVLARPAGAEGWFLPARAVSLSSDWSPAPQKARVGETLTRTLTLDAVGAAPNQLPPLDIPDVAGVRQYQEDSHSEAAMIAGEPGARLIKTLSIVPSRAGPVTLPALTVGWWDTKSNTQRTAELPAVTFDVAPAPQNGPPPAATPSAPEAFAGSGTAAPALQIEAPEAASQTRLLGFLSQAERLAAAALQALAESTWVVPGAAALVLAAAFAGILASRRAARLSPAASVSGPRVIAARGTGMSAAQAERAVRRACRRNDPKGAHAAYMDWRQAGAESARDGRAAETRTPQMALALHELRRHLYGPSQAQWRGSDFLAAFKREVQAARPRREPRQGERLAPLYPQG